jgi:hypothetical protein
MPKRIGDRTLEQVADRFVALMALHTHAMKPPNRSFEKSWGGPKIRAAMSSKEKSFYRESKPPMEKRIRYS